MSEDFDVSASRKSIHDMIAVLSGWTILLLLQNNKKIKFQGRFWCRLDPLDLSRMLKRTVRQLLRAHRTSRIKIEHSVHEIMYEADYFISFINCSKSYNVPPCQKAKIPHLVKTNRLNRQHNRIIPCLECLEAGLNRWVKQEVLE